ncbi:hypothetical protein [Ostreibacterium oceani]|uniref:Uncharacterized protein n=1 Tax=Ostreibacterium oceani TaxID=2654998 RepID=A0A6N7EYK1_9GAMM|nr:hypothetical protein [Ostreibacterium oceani]MPV86459.1 hypothetical protein [Ostreibacterium oceani]
MNEMYKVDFNSVKLIANNINIIKSKEFLLATFLFIVPIHVAMMGMQVYFRFKGLNLLLQTLTTNLLMLFLGYALIGFVSHLVCTNKNCKADTAYNKKNMIILGVILILYAWIITWISSFVLKEFILPLFYGL